MTKRAQSLRKAAILVSSLDTATADALLAQMEPSQAALVRRTVAELDDVRPSEREDVIREFFRTGPATAARKQSSGVELSLGNSSQPTDRRNADLRPTEKFTGLDNTHNVPFRCLQDADSGLLVTFLQNEHPQVMAVVVAHLPPSRAADVLHRLPADVQADVLRRLTDLDDANPDMLREIEQTIEAWLAKHSHSQRRRAAGLATVTAILQSADVRKKKSLLQNLALHDEFLAGTLGLDNAADTNSHDLSPEDSRQPIQPEIEFESLADLSDEELFDLFRAADPEVATLALAGASPELSNRIMRRMPSRDARRLRRALAHLGPTRLSDMEAAQHELAKLAMRMLAARRPAAQLSYAS